jgi:ribonuclease HII
MDSKYPTLTCEQELWKAGFTHIAGIDEAGRGAWAGPVYAAVVILPPDPTLIRILDRVRDSKLMTPKMRQAWAPRIREAAHAWAVGFASAQEIDVFGILPSTRLAATRALLSLSPDYLLTDYLIFPNIELPQTALVKGDRLSLSVAAASVLAKTARDADMCGMDDKYPDYGFARHKGYGTSLHRQALLKMGRCEIHRKSFNIP